MAGVIGGLAQGLIPTLLGGIFGEMQRRRAEQALAPFRMQPGTFTQRLDQATSPGGAGATVSVPQNLRGGTRTGEVEVAGGETGRQWANALLEGAGNRYQAERELEEEVLGQIGEYGEEFGQQSRGLERQGEEMRGQRTQGLQDIQGAAEQAQAAIAQGQAEVRANLAANVSAVQEQVAAFNQQAQAAISDMQTLRGEALAAASDQSARLLGNVSSGIQNQLNAQITEVEGRTDLPPAVRESMKQRLRFVNSQQLNETAANVMGQEAARLDTVRAQHDAMIGDVRASVTSATAGMAGAAAGALTEAYGAASGQAAALADAGAKYAGVFAEQSANYRTNMNLALADFQSQLAAFQMAGRMDMVNLMKNRPRAYLDVSDVMSRITQFNVDMTQLETQDQVTRLNAELGVHGFATQVAYTPMSWGAEVGGSAYLQATAPKPETGTSGAEWLSAAGSAATGAGSLWGAFKTK